MEIAKVLGREAQKDRPGNTACELLAVRSADAAPQSLEEFEFSSLTIDFAHK